MKKRVLAVVLGVSYGNADACSDVEAARVKIPQTQYGRK